MKHPTIDMSVEEERSILIASRRVSDYPECPIEEDRLYSEDEVCRVLKVDCDTLGDWRKRKIGPHWTILPGQLIRYYGSSLGNMLLPESSP